MAKPKTGKTPKNLPEASDQRTNNNQQNTILTAGFSHGMELVRPSLVLLRKNLEASVVIFILPSLLLTLSSLLMSDTNASGSRLFVGSLLLGLGVLWLIVSSLIAYYFEIQAVRDKQPGILESYRQGLQYGLRLIGLGVIVSLLVLGGLILLIIPGLIVLRRYSLAPYFLVDQNLGIREAMQRSAAASKPVSFVVYGVLFVSLVFAIASSAFARILPPVGSILGVIIGALYVLAPALLYQEVRNAKLGDEALATQTVKD